MIVRNPRRKKPKTCPVELAVKAVKHDGSAMDLPVEGFDPSPIALDLDDAEEAEIWPAPRSSRPAADACIICGQPVCEDCVSPSAAGDED